LFPGERPERTTEWLVTLAELVTGAAEVTAPAEVAYFTEESAVLFVVHVILAPVVVMAVAVGLVIVGS
jgi:hypothetical protein